MTGWRAACLLLAFGWLACVKVVWDALKASRLAEKLIDRAIAEESDLRTDRDELEIALSDAVRKTGYLAPHHILERRPWLAPKANADVSSPQS